MKKILAMILALLCLAALCACTPEEGGTELTAPVATAEIPTAPQLSTPTGTGALPADSETNGTSAVTEPTEPRVFFSIETPYATLRAPEEFGTEVKTSVVSEDPYVLDFSTTKDAELFKLHFGDGAGDLLGTLYNGEKPVVLTVEFADIDPNSADYETNARCQLGVGTIIDNLIADYGFAPNEVPTEEFSESFDIETSVCTLRYPSRWKDLVQIDVSEDAVKFVYQNAPVFDLYFTEDVDPDSAFLLGTYAGTPIYVVSYRAEEGLTEEELTNYYAMQANINFILEHLNEDPQFVESN